MNSLTRSRGFTLLEVIVALSILAISLAVVMQIFSGGLKNIYRIDLAHRAMSHGENVMNEILSDGDLIEPTSLSGELDEDFRYTAEIVEWEEPDPQLNIDVVTTNIRLLHVGVKIHFSNDRFGKHYTLNCLKAISTVDPSLNPAGGPQLNPVQQLFRGQQQRND